MQNDEKLWEFRKCLLEKDSAHAYEVQGDWVEPQSRYRFLKSNTIGPVQPVNGPSEATEPGYMHLKVVQRRRKEESYFSGSFECIGTPFFVTVTTPATGCSYVRLRKTILEHTRRFLSKEAPGRRNNMMLDEPSEPPGQCLQSADDDWLINTFTIAWHQNSYSSRFPDPGDIIKDDEGVSYARCTSRLRPQSVGGLS